MKKEKRELFKYLSQNNILNEIGVDEAGRGPMFGRVYAAAVILPKTDDYRHDLMKDSKKFSSERKIKEVAEYIKKNAICWSVRYSTEEDIDKYNIRVATHKAMHKAINDVIKEYGMSKDYHLLVDGNDFTNLVYFNTKMFVDCKYTCVKGGDNVYTSIAAASILAKVERDRYIQELCEENPELIERYDIGKNKGYGTKKHIEGIKTYGITPYHRKTFGICKNY